MKTFAFLATLFLMIQLAMSAAMIDRSKPGSGKIKQRGFGPLIDVEALQNGVCGPAGTLINVWVLNNCRGINGGFLPGGIPGAPGIPGVPGIGGGPGLPGLPGGGYLPGLSGGGYLPSGRCGGWLPGIRPGCGYRR